jgi:BirA family transcriptional regulator, biotin operon repressor / biotin---[acetyl-CoA-carboxylase] ligase
VPAETEVGTAGERTDRYDGVSAATLAGRLGLGRVDVYATIGSTMDAVHALGAAREPAGTLVLADSQTAGRGRKGNTWRSASSSGIWLTLLERPADDSGLQVLSLRVGVAAAWALDAFAEQTVRVKWPNDLYVGDGKVGGILVEARWRGGRPDWVAIGVGVNVDRPAELPRAAGLRPGTTRMRVLESLVPAVRAAVRAGPLDSLELIEYAQRDFACGQRCVSPGYGVVEGVTAGGELAVRTAEGVVHYRSGSLVLAEDR